VMALLGFQFLLGLADIVLLAPVWMQIVHLLGADLYWVALVTSAATVVWPKSGATLLSQTTP
jgi:heme a synthase